MAYDREDRFLGEVDEELEKDAESNVVDIFSREKIDSTIIDTYLAEGREGALQILDTIREGVERGEIQGVAIIFGQTDYAVKLPTAVNIAWCPTAERFRQLFVGGAIELTHKILAEDVIEHIEEME